jgi:hypothetical protein
MSDDTKQAAGGAAPTEPSTGDGTPVGANPSPPSRRKWPLLLFLSIAILVVVALAFWRKSVVVDISVKASQVSLRVDDRRFNRLFNSVDTKSLTVSTFEKITLAPGKLEATGDVDGRGLPVNWQSVTRPANAEHVIVPDGDLPYVTFNDVRLNSLDVPVGASADIIWSSDEPGSVNLRFNKDATGVASARSELLIFSCSQCRLDGPGDERKAPPTHFRLTAGREGANTITFTGRSDSTVMGLDLPGETKFDQQTIDLPNGISFIGEGGGSPISTIIEGTINFEQEVKKPIVLAKGALLDPELKNATIRTITVGQGVTVDLRGRAEKLRIGASEKDLKEQLPSVLEWLYANPWLAVLYAVAYGVVSLLLNFVGWWGGKDKKA